MSQKSRATKMTRRINQRLLDEIRAEIDTWPEDIRARLTSELAKRSYARREAGARTAVEEDCSVN